MKKKSMFDGLKMEELCRSHCLSVHQFNIKHIIYHQRCHIHGFPSRSTGFFTVSWATGFLKIFVEIYWYFVIYVYILYMDALRCAALD